MAESSELPQRLERLRGDQMRTPDEVAAMLRLRALGWGERRIAAEVGRNRRTVRRYLAADTGRRAAARRSTGLRLG